MKDTETLITETELQKMFGISRMTAWRWRREERLPFYRVGRRIYYSESQIRSFLNTKEVNPIELELNNE